MGFFRALNWSVWTSFYGAAFVAAMWMVCAMLAGIFLAEEFTLRDVGSLTLGAVFAGAVASWAIACVRFVAAYHAAQVFLFGKPIEGYVVTAGFNVLPTPFHTVESGSAKPVDVRSRSEIIGVEIVMDKGFRVDVVAKIVVNLHIRDVAQYLRIQPGEHEEWLERHAKACAVTMLSPMSIAEVLKTTQFLALRLACRLALGYYPEEAQGGDFDENRVALIGVWERYRELGFEMVDFYRDYYQHLLVHYNFHKGRHHSDIEAVLGFGIIEVLVKDFDFSDETKQTLERQGQSRAEADAQDVDVENMTRNIRKIVDETGVDSATASNMVMASRGKNTNRQAFSFENVGGLVKLIGDYLRDGNS